MYDFPAEAYLTPHQAAKPPATFHSPDELGYAILDLIDSGVEELEVPSIHYFADGLYGRRSTGEAGAVIVTQKHLKQHISVALKGHCTVVDHNGNKTEVHAPGVWITEPGTQRSIYFHTETEWLTVHANPDNITDVDAIEKVIALNTLAEYRRVLADRRDYPLMLEVIGISPDMARNISVNTSDLCDHPGDEISIRESMREGKGVFAEREFAVGDRVAAMRIGTQRPPAGRYMNHSVTPNVEFRLSDDGIDAYAIQPIYIGDEVLVNYRDGYQISMEADSRRIAA